MSMAESLNDRASRAAREAGYSLNDRANSAAGRAGATEDSQRVWKDLADREYYRSIPLNQRAEDAAKAARLRREAVTGMRRSNPSTPLSTVPSVTRSVTSNSQWGRGERDAVYASYADTLTKYGFDRAEVMQFLRGLTYTQLQNTSLTTQAFRETPMWQQRFGAVTKQRQQNGMSYINEGQIIALEDTYRQIFTAAGLPEKYYEQDDLNNLIANDVSPQEVADRVALAEDAINNTDPQYIRAFRAYYGVKKKDLVGYMLNREKGVQLLTEQAQAAEIGAEARTSGADVGKKFAEKLVDKDVSRQEARQAFSTVADSKKDWKKLGAMSDTDISERGLIKDELGLDKNGKVGSKKKRLASQERARFGGSGAGTGSLGASTSGAY